MQNIVVIGGGTGSYTVLSGLKKYPYNLASIVTTADSGGSTGRLRDEFGFLPVGDFRMALVALADENSEDNILRQLFVYRFDRGESGLKGHNFGNLFLTALTDLLGSEERAFGYASKVLRVKGEVLPITNKDITLVAEYEDDSVIFGETFIDEPEKYHDGTKRIKKIMVQPKAKIYERARKAIENADMIILGPGDLYTSTLVNTVVDGAAEAISKSRAILVYIVNLVTKYGQTHGFTTKDHVEEMKKYIGRCPDFIFINSTPLPKSILKRYKEEKAYPVKDDLGNFSEGKVIRQDFLAVEAIKKPSGDIAKRSLIRHHSGKVAKAVDKILKAKSRSHL